MIDKGIPFDTELQVLQINSTMRDSATQIYFFTYPNIELTAVKLWQGGGSVYHSCNPAYTVRSIIYKLFALIVCRLIFGIVFLDHSLNFTRHEVNS